MKIKAFVCDALNRPFYYFASLSESIVDIELLDSYNHVYPKKMHAIIQEKIDSVDSLSSSYDYIILGFGLCGNVLTGLKSRNIPLVVPRSHDCITLFMGDSKLYDKYLKTNPTSMYYIDSWIERNGLNDKLQDLKSIGLGADYEYYVSKYGQKRAEYLISIAMNCINKYNKGIYLKNDFVKMDYGGSVLKLMKDRKWDYEELNSNFDLIKDLLYGNWDEERFLIVDKNKSIYATGDNRIVDYE